MRATWYVLEDGTAVDPNECSADASGVVITHKSGARVAMRAPDAPQTRGVDVDENAAAIEKPAETPPTKTTADMRPAPKPQPARKQGYKTRSAKAR